MLDKKHDGFFDEATPEDRKSEELLQMLDGYEKPIKTYSKGDKVTGKVTRLGAEYVFIDIGAKNEAMIKNIELAGADGAVSVAPGDEVSGFIVEMKGGETTVSKSVTAGGGSADISALREALNTRVPVQGKVTGVSKAGLTVKIMGHRAFCPVSQIDVKYTSDVNEYLGKTLDFVITRITEGGKNIVVSRVPLFEAGLEEQFKKYADAAGSSKVLKGKISKIAEFGLFVEAGGLEGLVHISEVSWERAQNLNDSFTAGQEVEFVVLKVERKESLRNSKISLSIKQSLEDPWTKVSDRFKPGDSVEGKVTRLADFGAFVEIMPGVEGLVHVSEMAWGRRVHHPSEIVKPGQIVKVTVLGIDLNKRSVSLTLKDIADDPWKGIEEKLAVGADVAGTVARKAKFGYFIDLFEGVTGLLVFSRMTADKKDSLRPGDSVTVQVESIDTDSRRVALSMGVSDPGKETEDTKQYLKKQDARPEKKAGNGPSDTVLGAALMAALKSKPGANPAAPAKASAKPAAHAEKAAPAAAPAPQEKTAPAKAAPSAKHAPAAKPPAEED
ncbi:MAG: S1 RNA-binding domain-containing protein [Chitinispirillia bacterium]|nr:S1 RNA-binding domain-containing protein [Chitinispirillia bacterium]MCL2242319.1 S1 RNA-binding domain-containing protein [Chitinispirillia bacterium]